VCHSSSKVCREFANFITDNAKILQPGATMYWRDRGSVCPIPNDAASASFPGLVSEMGLACSASAASDHRVFKAAQTGTPQVSLTLHLLFTDRSQFEGPEFGTPLKQNRRHITPHRAALMNSRP
jgi:hypothetical protein